MLLRSLNLFARVGYGQRSRSFLESFALSTAKSIVENSLPKTTQLAVEKLDSNVYSVRLNRPKKKNAINMKLWNEIHLVFDFLDSCDDCLAVVLSGSGNSFCSGLDLEDALPKLLEISQNKQLDVGRKALALRKLISMCQNSISSISNCKKPVIASICGPCIGAGTSVASAADIRYACEDAYFSIKEIDLGITADVGVLNRINNLVGNDSAIRELTFTGRKFTSDEALEIGFISKQFACDVCFPEAVALAKEIATKSPTAVIGAKLLLNNARDHTIKDSLEYVKLWNQTFLQSIDLVMASSGLMSGELQNFRNK